MNSRRRTAAACVAVQLRWMATVLLAWDFATSAAAHAEQDDATRPVVVARLKTGEVLEGRLHRFVDGRYTLEASGRSWHFHERDVESLSFQQVPEVPNDGPLVAFPQLDKMTTAELVEAFAHPRRKLPDPDHGDPQLIPALASRGEEVIRPLIQQVAANSNLYQNTGQVFQLLGPKHFPAMLAELQAGTPGARLPIAWALQQDGVRSATILRELLAHRDPRIRDFALETLYNIGIQSGTVLPSTLTPALLKLMDDPIQEVRKQVPAVLAMVGRPLDAIAPCLLSAIPESSARSDLASECALALSSLGGELRAEDAWREEIDEAMRSGLSHPDSSVRSVAARYFGSAATPVSARTIELLRRAADDPQEYVRQTARESLYALGYSPNEAGLQNAENSVLARTLASEDSMAAQQAVQVLTTRDATAELLAQLMDVVAADRSSRYWHLVPPILQTWNPEKALPWLEEHSTSTAPLVRRVVAATYAKFPLDHLPPSMERLSADRDMLVRSEAIRTLARVATKSKGRLFEETVPLLLQRVSDTSIHREYHWAACDAVVEVGTSHPDVVPAVLQLATDSHDAGLREAMMVALGEIASDLRDDSPPRQQIVQGLVQLLDSERTAELKIKAIEALGYAKVTTPLVKDALGRAADDPRRNVADAARKALQ